MNRLCIQHIRDATRSLWPTPQRADAAASYALSTAQTHLWPALCGPAGLAQSLQCLAKPQPQTVRAATPVAAGAKIGAIANDDSVPQIIVVLGVPTPAGGPLCRSLQNRVNQAAALYGQNPSARVVCSGAAVLTPQCEADAMFAGLQRLGVPAECIARDREAMTTKQNAENTFKILKSMNLQGRHRLTLVVEPYQAVRALRVFVQARAQHAFAEDFVIALAPVERLTASKSAPYTATRSFRPKQLGRGWTEALGGICSPQIKQDFERQLSERVKMMWGY